MQEPLNPGLWGSEQGIQDALADLYGYVNEALKWREDSLRQQADGLQVLRQGIHSSLDTVARQVEYLATYQHEQEAELKADDHGECS